MTVYVDWINTSSLPQSVALSANISDPVLEALTLFRLYGHRVPSQTQGVADVSASDTTISLEVVVVQPQLS